jgi:triacylglycerol lipase
VSFYNKHIINQQQVHYQPVAASRTSGEVFPAAVGGKRSSLADEAISRCGRYVGVLIPGAGEPSPVGAVKDFSISRKFTEGPDVAVRTFTPASPAPASGYPLLIWLHGGGWVN